MTKEIIYFYNNGAASTTKLSGKNLYCVRFYENGSLHRLDGPAVEYEDNHKMYYVEGKQHRLDGPAVEWLNGDKEYWVEGKLHRLDGPAIECADGAKYYYVESKLHRLDGPAIESPDGEKQYWVNGKRHRLDGPAVDRSNALQYHAYFINDVNVTDKVIGIKEEDIPKYLRILSL